jgi:hypothetical protein
MIRPFFICCAAIATLIGHSHASDLPHKTAQNHSATHSWDTSSFKIEDSKCRVGIASVKLTVSELVPHDGNLVATYAIHVPLSKSNNDTGQIVLPINISIDELARTGGVLKGHSYSDKKKEVANTIICKIGPPETKGITLEITTPKRTLNFESRYTVIESNDNS